MGVDEVDVAMAFELPLGSKKFPILGLQHNHEPIEEEHQEEHLFYTNIYEIQVSLGWCQEEVPSGSVIFDCINKSFGKIISSCRFTYCDIREKHDLISMSI